ncbi:MAG: hypothetical protein FJX67_05690 [Alphaproteobacteria bacterium]|nr:hypothetical protein [Alphaproteobacteria bacterium]
MRISFYRRLVAVALAFPVVGLATPSPALVLTNCDGAGFIAGTTCTLGALVANRGAIRVEDKVFEAWGYVIEGIGFSVAEGAARAANADLVQVQGLDSGGPVGLRFTGTQSTFEIALGGDDGDGQGGSQLSAFRYAVRVLDPGQAIVGNVLRLTDATVTLTDGTDALLGDSTALAQIAETPTAAGGDPLSATAKLVGRRQALSQSGALTTPFDDDEDSRLFAMEGVVDVETQVFLDLALADFAGGSLSGLVRLGSFEQRFAQARIAEPGTLMVFVAALALLVLHRVRRDRRPAPVRRGPRPYRRPRPGLD